ncbi:disco-interacting protein 2 homolog A [Sinocyclocheilus grahami]|uniref:disco-interacting protein 2 homolog A n=1 Tax=Sinocyclocheilus grahami TaxID=75366 RepID=UPI0007AC55EC|nr:PREDICTED: disco-interacting protein 2 homolog A [Sinocyclocheilus grahami]
MAERSSTGLLMMMLDPSPAIAMTLPAEVREKLAELELELSEGDITQKGYEKKRGKLLAPYIPQIQGVDPSLQIEHRIQTSSQVAPPGSKQNKPRVANSRDERFRSDLHTEAVQAALAKYKERKMPMPSKRRSVLVQSSVEACTPPDTSSASEDEGSLRRQGRIASSSPYQAHPSVEHWFNRVIQGSSTSSSASSTSSHPGGRPHHATNTTSASAATVLADLMAHTQLDNHSAPPDVTGLSERSVHAERPQVASVRGLPRGYTHTTVMETADGTDRGDGEAMDGVPVNSRVSSKIQQLLNTLKRPKRPPLREFFVDDFEELLDVQHPDPNQPKPEGGEMRPLNGEPLGVVTNWPPSLLASLQRWGTTQPKSPCLTALDNAGKPIYTLTYGKLWTRSQKLAYTLLNKLSTRNEPLLRPGDRVALVFPNNDPVMFMVAFYACLLAELVPVPIEVPLTRKDAGSQQVGFLLGSCGVTLALTTDACQKGLPKAQTGEVVTFKGWPRLLWFVTDGKHVVKPPKDWHPPIRDASNEIAYIEVRTIPVTSSGAPISDRPFTRTSLLGFIGPDNLVFVVGKMDGLMVVSGRRHNADDVVATALAVEPMKFVYRGRIAVFSVSVLHDERIVVVAEQRPDASEEDSFQWMSRVLQAIDSIHQVGVYCLALVPANTLPKAPLGGIHISETKQRFLEGALHPCNVLMCPHTCVTNLPKPRQKQPGTEVGPASMIVGNLVAGKRIAQACGRDVSQLEDNDQFLYMQDVLQWRAQATPDHPLFLLLNAKGTVANTASCVQLHKRAERVAVALMERGRLNTGDHVALVYPPGIDLIATFYGCLYAGCVPVTVRPPHPQNLTTTLPTVKMIVELRNVNLSCVRTCMVVAEERPRITLTQSFSKIFKDLGLSSRAVSTTFGCRVNVAICLQGTSGPDPTTVYLDMRALRHDRVRLVERGSPHSLPLMESGKILPGVKVIIANTETKGPLGDSHLGEIWVSGPHNATGYYTVYGEEALHADHFSTRLSFGDTQTVWARTGYLGFLRRTELTDASGERHDIHLSSPHFLSLSPQCCVHMDESLGGGRGA